MTMNVTTSDLEAMLAGYAQRRAAIVEQIEQLQRRLHGEPARVVEVAEWRGNILGPPLKKKRRLSAAGRARIIAATKARWARVRAAQKSARRTRTEK